MPRTKLGQGFNDSAKKANSIVKATSKANTEVKVDQATIIESDDLMADFQIPDDLRKQLEYPASAKKRKLAIDHAERKLVERLAMINARLKEDNVKVSIQRVGDSLVLQTTLPLKPNEVSKDGNPNKQTKVSLGIPFSADGLKTAEKEARELGTLKALNRFEWNEKYLGNKAPKLEVIPTIGELLEQFENKYFLTRKRNRQSKNTFERHISTLNKYLTSTRFLTELEILTTIQKTETGSGARMNLVTSLSVFCNTFEFNFDFKGYKNGYEPKKRILPTDKEIEERFHNFELFKHRSTSQWQAWRWVYGMLATYGLRPHEIFAIHIKDFVNPNNTLHELRLDETTTEGIKTGERTVFPLHPNWVELFDLKNVKMPKVTTDFSARTSSIANVFQRHKIGFPPYNLRHAYAVRGHELGIPLKEMADNMGHSVDMHTTTYQKYMTIDSRRIVYQKALTKADDTKTEQSKIELLQAENDLLKTENAALKAKNESLEALLVQYQLDEM